MSDDSGRNSDGTFAEGNLASPNTGGGYGAERNLNVGKLSARLQAASLARQRQIVDGGVRALLIELAGDFLAVSDALKVTIVHARARRAESELLTATRHWHTIAANAARQLQWLAEHPDDDGKKTLDGLLGKGADNAD